VATALLQSIDRLFSARAGAADLAAAISTELKRFEVVIRVFSIGIAAGDQVCDVVAARGPDQEHHATLPQTKALKAWFTVPFTAVFHCDHRLVEDRFPIGEVDLVLP
jgi:hypothetical protein